MTAAVVLAGVVGILLAFAVLLLVTAPVMRALAVLLPSAFQCWYEVRLARAQAANRPLQEPFSGRRAARGTAAEREAAEMPEWAKAWVAPPPVMDTMSPTEARMPAAAAGDDDQFEEAGEEEAREVAPGSKLAAPPPGPPIEGEPGFRVRVEDVEIRRGVAPAPTP